MTGTLLNVATTLVGAIVGAFLGTRFPERVRQTVMAGLGALTLVVGVTLALRGNILVMLASILIGGILGELLRIDDGVHRLGAFLERRFGGGGASGDFTRGFVTASLVYCVGPLTILGSIQDGLLGDYRLLAVKSLLDMFAALAFGSALGIGVAFAALTVLVVQGGISLLSMLAGSALGTVTADTPWVVQMSGTGGVVIMLISLILLELKPVRVANFTPSIFIAPLIVVALEFLNIALP